MILNQDEIDALSTGLQRKAREAYLEQRVAALQAKQRAVNAELLDWFENGGLKEPVITALRAALGDG